MSPNLMPIATLRCRTKFNRWPEINVHHRHATGKYIPDKPIVNLVGLKLRRMQTMIGYLICRQDGPMPDLARRHLGRISAGAWLVADIELRRELISPQGSTGVASMLN
jgi:hypothetical protein